MGVYVEVRDFVLPSSVRRPSLRPCRAADGERLSAERCLWVRGRVQTVGDSGRCGRGPAQVGVAGI